MAKTRVLYVLHNHPAIFPGGTEMYALELFDALRGSDEIDDETAAAIAEVVQTKDGARVRFHDKAAAIAQLTRILGLTDDTRESGNITVQIMNFSTMPQPVPPLERKEAPTIERMRSQQQRGRGNG